MKTIVFLKENNNLLIHYSPNNDIAFVSTKLSNNSFILKKTFYFETKDLALAIDYENNECQFYIAKLVGKYYKFDKNILSINFNVYIDKDIEMNMGMFTASRNISIFKKIDKLVDEDIYIGFDDTCNLPYAEFQRLLTEFPSTYELDKYSESRVGMILEDYLSLKKDSVNSYEKYMNKKISFKGESLGHIFDEYEREKYKIILEKLEFMLDNDEKYSEVAWQNEIVEIILLIFPKYIQIFKEVSIKNVYSGSNKRVDFMLVSYAGHIDIIEIKKSTKNILRSTNYRGNYIPSIELSGAIMQVEKYIYFLNKWSKDGEEKLTQDKKKYLPDGLSLKITNPQAMLIIGRNKFNSEEEDNDFEVIKRKYKNIVDILTYDDLILRIKRLINKFK